jgi:hypothetical protein
MGNTGRRTKGAYPTLVAIKKTDSFRCRKGVENIIVFFPCRHESVFLGKKTHAGMAKSAWGVFRDVPLASNASGYLASDLAESGTPRRKTKQKTNDSRRPS